MDAVDVKNRHAHSLLFGLDTLRTSHGWSLDCNVKVGDETFEAHSMVLASCSGYFRSKIRERWNDGPRQVLEIYLEGVTAIGARLCIDFMYTGTATLTSENILDVMQGADKMNLEALIDLCLRSLDGYISPENCFQIRKWYRKFDMRDEAENVKQFIEENINIVLISGGFLNLEMADLVEWLKEIEFANHKLLWRSITSWVNFEPERRNQRLPSLLDDYLMKFPPDFLITGLHERTSSSETQKEQILSTYMRGMLSTDDNYVLINTVSNHTTDQEYLQARNLLKILIVNQFEEISATAGIVNLTVESIDFIFDALHTSNVSEQTKYKVIIKWTKHSIPQRNDHFAELFTKISLKKIEKDFLDDIIREEPLVRSSNPCCRHILESCEASPQPSTPVRNRIDDYFQQIPGSSNTTPKRLYSDALPRPPLHSSSPKKARKESLSHKNGNKAATQRKKSSEWNIEEERYFIAIHDSHSILINGVDLKTGRFCTLSKTKSFTDHFRGIVEVNEQLYWMQGSSLKRRKDNKRWEKLRGTDENPTSNSKIASFQNHIYLVQQKRIFVYDPMTNSWEKRSVDGLTGNHFCICATNEHLYILGGDEVPKRALEYDPFQHTTREVVPMIQPRVNAAAVSVDRKVYVLGGSHPEVGKSIECYDPDIGWMELAGMKTPRWKLCACVYDNKIFAIGGAGRSSNDSVEVYDFGAAQTGWKHFSRGNKIGIPFTACVVKTAWIKL